MEYMLALTATFLGGFLLGRIFERLTIYVYKKTHR